MWEAAIFPGRVERIEHSDFWYGKAVLVDHGQGLKSFYAHLSKILISRDEEVSPSTKIGEIGSTGRSFGDHLHLEVYRSGRIVNPLTMLSN